VKSKFWSFPTALALSMTLCVALLALTPRTWSQGVTASITGTVTDPSGAAVPGATVTVTETDRGTIYSAQTNSTGIYNLLRVPVGTYTLRVEARGFQTTVQPAFTLVLNQAARMDFQLKVGSPTATVEVTSGAPVLQTETTQVSTIIDSRTNEALPLASRNYIQLTLLAPGSVQPNPQTMVQAERIDSAGRPYINGNREQSDNFLLDGMDNNEVSDNLVGYQPSVDAIQEFNLITQNAPAEFGSFAGGIINATIKSGTDQYHGDAFEFIRNDKFNANSWQNNLFGLPKNKLRWNMFGATFGGPIKKDKLFFFVDYQGQRFDFPSSSAAPVKTFTAAERAGNFGDICNSGFTSGICNDRDPVSGAIINQLYSPYNVDSSGNRLPYANNVITDPINPVAQALFSSSAYPQATSTSPSTNYYNYNTASALNVDQGDVKLDYNISQKDRIFFRYSHAYQNNPQTATGLGTIFGGVNDGHATMHNGVLDWAHLFSGNFVNDARVGVNYVRLDTNNTDTRTLGNLGLQIGIPNANTPGPGLLGLNFSGVATNIGGAAVVQLFASTVFQYEDNLIITHGRNTFNVGFQFWRDRIDAYYSGNNGQLGSMAFSGKFTQGLNTTNNAFQPGVGAGSGYGGADFYLGLSDNQGRGSVSGTWGQRANVLGAYFQDNLQVSQHLTLNLGLRYEDHTPWYEVDNRQDNFGLFSGQLEAPNCSIGGLSSLPISCVQSSNRALYNSYNGLGNYQPRVGFAWTPGFLNDKTVLRGAYTVSTYLEGTGTNLRPTLNPPFSDEFQAVYDGTQFQSPSGLPPTINNGLQTPPVSDPFQGAILRLWNPNVRPELDNQWNLTLQQRLNDTTSIQVGYVGQKGTHLMVPMNYDQQIVTPGGCSGAASNCVLTGNGVYNLLSPGPYIAGNPTLKNDLGTPGYISGTESNGTMFYNALQVVLQKRFSSGLQYNVAYTYSKCNTNSIGYYGSWGGSQTVPSSPYFQNIYNSAAEWGPCYYDVTNDVTAYAVYQVPVGTDRKYGKDMNKMVNAVVGNWNLSPIVTLRGGFPLTFEYYDYIGSGTRGERPDCSGAIAHVGSPSTTPGIPGVQWFSGANVSAPAGAFGTCGIGSVRGPGEKDVDLSVQKNFPLGETKNLEVRSEFINLFNHPILSPGYCTIGFGGAGCGTGYFGVIQGSQLERNIQFALKFSF